MNDVIVRERVASQVHRYLRDKILKGDFVAGTRLVEADIAAELRVSRTPVREALVLLQSDGFVQSLDTGGFTVCDLRRELMDVLDIRIALETHAVRKAAVCISDEEIGELHRICDEMEALASDEVKGRAVLNRRFHETLIGAAHNCRLVKIVTEYQDYFAVAQRLFDSDAIRRTQKEHRAIVTALERRDVEAAAHAVADHIAGAGELILGSIGPASKARGDADRRN